MAAAVALLVVGVVAGYAAASALAPESTTSGGPEPVVASSPRIPVDPMPTANASPSVAALGTDLPMRDARLGNGGLRLVHPVPVGWARLSNGNNEAKWKRPNNPPDTFILRVENVVSREDTIAETISDRIVDLRDEKERFSIEERTASTLEFTYVSDGFPRHGFLSWLDLRGTGVAEVEVAVTGREMDARGAGELISRVTGGMRLAEAPA
jgi:hypothetical protein